MKKYLAVTLLVMIIILSCQKKSVPTISSRTSEPSLPKADTGMIVPDKDRGQLVFNNRCGRCHGLPEPGQYSSKRWETIMASMAPKARLSKEDRVHVTAWVMANANSSAPLGTIGNKQ
jgi:mono/diheme cytochrome c family protein